MKRPIWGRGCRRLPVGRIRPPPFAAYSPRSFPMKNSPLLALTLMAGALLPACAELEDARNDEHWRAGASQEISCREDSDAACEQSAPESQAADQADVITTQALPSGDRATSALLITKTLPPVVQRNEEFTYAITVENLTSKALNNVKIEERLPESLTLLASDPGMSSNENGVANWELGTLEAGATLAVSITGKATADGLAASYALVTYDSPLKGQIQVVSPSLALELKTPDSATLGESFEIVLTVNNTGAGIARSVDLSAVLPEGIEASEGSENVMLPELAPGASHTMTIQATAVTPGSFTATAAASMNKGEPITLTGSAIQVQDTRLELTATGPSKLYLGQPGRITLTVKNVGTTLAKEVQLEQTIPADLKLGRVSSPVEQEGDLLSWTLGDMEPGTETVITLYLTPTQIGALDLAVTAQATHGSAAESSYSASMEGISALHFTLEDLQDPVSVGESLTYLLKVHNQGTAPGENIEVVATMDEGMQLVHAKGPTNGHTEGNKIIFNTLDSLDPGATATWRLVLKSQQVGDLRLGAALTSKRLRRPVEVTQSTQFYE